MFCTATLQNQCFYQQSSRNTLLTLNTLFTNIELIRMLTAPAFSSVVVRISTWWLRIARSLPLNLEQKLITGTQRKCYGHSHDLWSQQVNYTSGAALRWRHNGPDSVSNHQPHDRWLKRLFRRRSKKTSKLRVTGLCAGNSPGTGEFPAQMASNAENVSIWWHHHVHFWGCVGVLWLEDPSDGIVYRRIHASLGLNELMPRLPMPWLLASPGHQQPCCWPWINFPM